VLVEFLVELDDFLADGVTGGQQRPPSLRPQQKKPPWWAIDFG
jgi:hypothetical protein